MNKNSSFFIFISSCLMLGTMMLCMFLCHLELFCSIPDVLSIEKCFYYGLERLLGFLDLVTLVGEVHRLDLPPNHKSDMA